MAYAYHEYIDGRSRWTAVVGPNTLVELGCAGQLLHEAADGSIKIIPRSAQRLHCFIPLKSHVDDATDSRLVDLCSWWELCSSRACGV